MSIAGASGVAAIAANERLYPSKNLIGTWVGGWDKQSSFSLQVVSIKAGIAQIKYTHNNHTEIGTATVSQNQLTYGAITIGTRNGTNGVAIASFGTVEKRSVLTKLPDQTQAQATSSSSSSSSSASLGSLGALLNTTA